MKICFNLEMKMIGMAYKMSQKCFKKGKRVSKYRSFNLLIYRNTLYVPIFYIFLRFNRHPLYSVIRLGNVAYLYIKLIRYIPCAIIIR